MSPISRLFSWLLVLLLCTGIALAEETVPILRIEVGQHIGVINRAATDAQRQLLATVADDKTLRLWNLPEGTLYSTLRVPIGEQLKGALYAVALSPDGKTVAVAGATGSAAEKFSIYLFDVAQRQLQARLSNLPSAIYHLAYSADGSKLAAVFDAGYGLKVWDAHTGKQLLEDLDYQDRSTWVDFSATGELATVAYDGHIRLYDASLKLSKKLPTSSGKHPYSVKYSPDGQRLAIGYADQKKVDIYASTGEALRHLSLEDLTGAQSAIVSWRPDAQANYGLLVAGDLKNPGYDFVVREYSDVKQDNPDFVDIVVGKNIVTDIVGIWNDDLDYVITTADPKWTALKTGRISHEHQANLWNARIVELENKRFALSPDGLALQFATAEHDDRSLEFNLNDLSLQPSAESNAKLSFQAPITHSDNLNITHWRRSQHPELNSEPLLLGEFERSAALAIAPDQRSFLLGTNHYLRLYNPQGKEIIKQAVEAEVFGLNIAANGQLAVAALADGTLRWYSLRSGDMLHELLVLFPYNDGQQWLAWTPEGYFAHSLGGGSELAGFQLNKGANKRPEWIAFAQLYQKFYNPEFLLPKVQGKAKDAHVIQEGAQTASQHLSSQQLPVVKLLQLCAVDAESAAGFSHAAPVSGWLSRFVPESWRSVSLLMRLIHWLEQIFGDAPTTPAGTQMADAKASQCLPVVGQGETRGFARVKNANAAAIYRNQFSQPVKAVELRYRVEKRSGGMGDVDVYANGQIQAQADTSTEEVRQVIALTPGVNQIYVQAYEQSGGSAAKSEVVQLINPEAGSAPDTPPARLIVLTVGIDAYPPPNTLKYAVKDARDVLQTIQAGKSKIYERVVPFELSNEQATLQNIQAKIAEISAFITPADTVLLYFSGHGVLEGKHFYFLPYDVNKAALASTSIAQQHLKRFIAQLAKTNKIFMFIDSCHSGSFDLQAINNEITSFDKLKQQLGENVFILAASGADQEAQDQFVLADGTKPSNGLFAWAVLDGLRGKASRQDDDIVDNYNLGSYVQRKVDALTQKQTLYPQKARFQVVNNGDVTIFDITQALH